MRVVRRVACQVPATPLRKVTNLSRMMGNVWWVCSSMPVKPRGWVGAFLNRKRNRRQHSRGTQTPVAAAPAVRPSELRHPPTRWSHHPLQPKPQPDGFSMLRSGRWLQRDEASHPRQVTRGRETRTDSDDGALRASAVQTTALHRLAAPDRLCEVPADPPPRRVPVDPRHRHVHGSCAVVLQLEEDLSGLHAQ